MLLMEMANCLMVMALIIRGNLIRDECMEKENTFLVKQNIGMMDSINIISEMDKEDIIIINKNLMKDSGLEVNSVQKIKRRSQNLLRKRNNKWIKNQKMIK